MLVEAICLMKELTVTARGLVLYWNLDDHKKGGVN